MDIKIFFKDGTNREFLHEGRPGGSYTKSIRYEDGMAIVTDEYYNETAFPIDLIEHVETQG